MSEPPDPGAEIARRTLRIAPFLIGAWTAAALLSAAASGLAWTDPPAPAARVDGAEALDSWWGLLLRSAISGTLIGVVSAWLETAVLPGWGRRFPLGVSLALRTLAYALVVSGAVLGILFSTAYWGVGLTPAALLANPAFQAFRETGVLARFTVALVGSSFVINLALQLRRVLGPETLKALFLGTYRRPRREERAFVFLDLADSTTWAERLGPLAFTDFKNDFFGDVAEPVLATGGRIVQYVGDEVMVSWPITRAEADAAPLRFFFLVEARIDARADRYRARYGDVPSFKAGAHGGEVVTAEVGDLKRDIVHSGDVVNTAARIEAECRPRGHRLLVSQSLLDRMPALPEATVTRLGAAPLRGKAAPVEIAAVARPEAAASEAPAEAA
ncbi:MAG: adenylate/guanylate cyclase domain-containing protein [Bacteroidota bacterium]